MARDAAKACKDGIAAAWSADHPTWSVALHVDDDYAANDSAPTLLVADDGSTRLVGDSWTVRQTPRRRDLRLTAFAKGRSKALEVVEAAVQHLLTNRPADIARFEDVSDPMTTRDRKTGAYLAWIAMPAITRP